MIESRKNAANNVKFTLYTFYLLQDIVFLTFIQIYGQDSYI